MSLLIEIDRFLRRTQMAETRFGRLAVRDPRLVHDLRLGREPQPPMISKVRTFMAEHPR